MRISVDKPFFDSKNDGNCTPDSPGGFEGRNKKAKVCLDINRPSHGRSWGWRRAIDLRERRVFLRGF